MKAATGAPQLGVWPIVVMSLAFFVAALGEELGWSGYATDAVQARSNALTTGLILGLIWAAWHWVPLVQAHRTVSWIAWWSLYTVALRVLIVWLYNNTGKSVFAATIFHANTRFDFGRIKLHLPVVRPTHQCRESRS